MNRTQNTIAGRYIPANSTTITHAKGVVYSYTTPRGVLAAVAYRGAARRSAWHYTFRSEQARQSHIDGFLAGLDRWVAAKQQRRIERARPHTIGVGAIIVNSWGWEQTNIDFYQVVRVSKQFVWLRPIAEESSGEAGFMTGTKVALPGEFTSERVTQHKATADNSVNFEHGGGWIWGGRPQHYSWYA